MVEWIPGKRITVNTMNLLGYTGSFLRRIHYLSIVGCKNPRLIFGKVSLEGLLLNSLPQWPSTNFRLNDGEPWDGSA